MSASLVDVHHWSKAEPRARVMVELVGYCRGDRKVVLDTASSDLALEELRCLRAAVDPGDSVSQYRAWSSAERGLMPH